MNEHSLSSCRAKNIDWRPHEALLKDLDLDGCKVPAGTIILAYTGITSRLEENFPQPDQFRPERWTEESSSKVNFATLPFGYGSRFKVKIRDYPKPRTDIRFP